MRNVKVWLCAAMFMTGLACATLSVWGPTAATANQKTAVANHWRFHDGHWNYWNDGDQHWYYTDGTNWYYNNNNMWNVYGFDKQFGREGFERGDYKVPANGAKIEIPRHTYYRAPGK